MTDQDSAIVAIVRREYQRLGGFIRQRVLDKSEAEDILQDVFSEFVAACQLPAPIEQASAWLFQVARNRIIDRFRKKKEVALDDFNDDPDSDHEELRLDLALPSSDLGPEADYVRAQLLTALQQALDELPANQREVFLAHEVEGRSFKDMAAETGTPLNTLLARKRYAVLYLRERLQTIYNERDN